MAAGARSLQYLTLCIGVLYLVLLASPAVSITCFQCNSYLHEGCAQISPNDTESEFFRPCDGDYEGEQPFCRKTVVEIKESPDRVVRSCGWKNHTLNCYHIDDGHHIEYVCQCFTDGCNLSPNNQAPAALLLLIVTGALLVMPAVCV